MFKIANCVRPSRFGDLISSLPFLNWLEKQYPNSYKMVLVDRACSQIAPLLINHPLIDKIYITEETDKITPQEEEWFKKFDLVMEPFVPITKEDWFNEIVLVEESFCMNWLRGRGRIDPNEWNKLTKEERKPHLTKWFNTEKQGNYIAIWHSAGYQNSDPANLKRNPSPEYWRGLIDILIKEGYEIAQLGLPALNLHPDILNLSYYSLFEAIKFTLGSSILSLGTDSGSQWICGAYGHPQIILSTYWRKGHVKNQKAHIPVNCDDRLICLFHETDINKIDYYNVIEMIKELT